jgi:hypothetical protein
MRINKLKVTVQGPLWRIHELDIEAIPVIDKWKQNDEETEGWVEVKEFDVSIDNILDVFINLGAPNGTEYKVLLSGKATDAAGEHDIEFEDDYEVIRNGRLRITISNEMSEITTLVTP